MAEESENECASDVSELETIDSDDSNDNEPYSTDSGKENVNEEISAAVCGRGQGRGYGRGCGCRHGHGCGHGDTATPELVWSHMIVEPIVHTWQGNPAIVGPHICLATQKLSNDWFSLKSLFFIFF